MRIALVAFVIAVLFAIACVVFVVISTHNPRERGSSHGDPPAARGYR